MERPQLLEVHCIQIQLRHGALLDAKDTTSIKTATALFAIERNHTLYLLSQVPQQINSFIILSPDDGDASR